MRHNYYLERKKKEMLFVDILKCELFTLILYSEYFSICIQVLCV